MDITCEKCKREYELDEEQVTPTGVTVQCTGCGHVFMVKKKAVFVTEPVMASPTSQIRDTQQPAFTSGEWMVRQADGKILTFNDLSVLRKWVVDFRISKDDEISRQGENWKRLGEIAELASLFLSVEQTQFSAPFISTLKTGSKQPGAGTEASRQSPRAPGPVTINSQPGIGGDTEKLGDKELADWESDTAPFQQVASENAPTRKQTGGAEPKSPPMEVEAARKDAPTADYQDAMSKGMAHHQVPPPSTLSTHSGQTPSQLEKLATDLTAAMPQLELPMSGMTGAPPKSKNSEERFWEDPAWTTPSTPNPMILDDDDIPLGSWEKKGRAKWIVVIIVVVVGLAFGGIYLFKKDWLYKLFGSSIKKTPAITTPLKAKRIAAMADTTKRRTRTAGTADKESSRPAGTTDKESSRPAALKASARTAILSKDVALKATKTAMNSRPVALRAKILTTPKAVNKDKSTAKTSTSKTSRAKSRPKSYRGLYRLGKKMIDRAPRKAIAAFKDALAVKKTASAYLGLGNAYWNLNEYTNAKNAYLKAMGTDPNTKAAFIQLGGVYKKLGHRKKALEYYRLYIERFPKGPEANVAKTNIDNLASE